MFRGRVRSRRLDTSAPKRASQFSIDPDSQCMMLSRNCAFSATSGRFIPIRTRPEEMSRVVDQHLASPAGRRDIPD